MARRTIFRVHAIRRMFKRRIGRDDVHYVIQAGEIIEEYPDDQPYPSRLILGWMGSRPLHIVLADNEIDEEWIVVTVYEPDPAQWDNGFKRRKR